MKESVSASFKLGQRSVLPQSWQGKNILLPDNKFYFVEEGEIVVEMDGERFLVQAGELLLIPAKTLHSCSLSQKGYAKKAWCHFEMKRGGEDFFDCYDLPRLVKVNDRREVSALFDELFAANEENGVYRISMTAAALHKLTGYFLKVTGAREKSAPTDGVDEAIEFLNTHYTESVTLSELAGIANYSPNHLIRRFKEKTGYTPVRYLHAVRVEKAKKLLTETDESVGEIMEKVGFLDSAYFSKLFKKQVGYSPKKFRDTFQRKEKQ